jgi:hypothetical protein
MTDARERVQRFLDHYYTEGSNIHPEFIHTIWRTIDGDAEQLHLTVSDLREVLNGGLPVDQR